jgi:hypothetical protein
MALCVAVLTVQHEGKCEVNYGLCVIYRRCCCDLDAVPDVPPVCGDSYLAADRRLLNFRCILWDISQFRNAN